MKSPDAANTSYPTEKERSRNDGALSDFFAYLRFWVAMLGTATSAVVLFLFSLFGLFMPRKLGRSPKAGFFSSRTTRARSISSRCSPSTRSGR